MIKGDKRKIGLYLSGKPVLIQELNVAITQPTIEEIVMFGEDDFLFASQLMAHTDEFVEEIKRGNFELDFISNFQLLMTIVKQDNFINKTIVNYLEFIFPEYQIELTDNEILFYIEIDEQKKIVSRINPFNFDILKDIIGNLFIMQPLDEEIEYNPADDLAKAIADKIKEGRKKTASLKNEKTKDQSFLAQITSSLSIGLQMDLNIFYKYTLFQLYDTYKRFFLKQSYDLYQKISITPLMDNSKMDVPDEWTKYMY